MVRCTKIEATDVCRSVYMTLSCDKCGSVWSTWLGDSLHCPKCSSYQNGQVVFDGAVRHGTILANTPWPNPSTDDQRTHAILHAVKAVGKLVAIIEAEAHPGRTDEPTAKDQPKYAADLVISAIRLADVCGFDLELAVKERQRQRNGMMPVAPGSL